MKCIDTIAELQAHIGKWRANKARIGLVTTMGNLHAGHMALINHAQANSTHCIVSVFVNPLQFAPGEDYQQYPRSLDSDLEKLAAQGVDLAFTPSNATMYPKGSEGHTTVHVPHLSQRHCGMTRTNFFRGITTVVAKLFNLTMADFAIFGEKDFQQLRCIQAMVRDLAIPITILSVATVRETDGLAISSRNQYLTDHERGIAPLLYQQLRHMKSLIEQGERDYHALQTDAKQQLQGAGFVPDYITVCEREQLQAASMHDHDLIILAAATLGRARLIDNICCEAR